MSVMFVALAAFMGVAALVGGVAMVLRDKSGGKMEDRLDVLTGASSSSAAKDGTRKEKSVLSQPLDGRTGMIDLFLERFGNINLFFEQADTSLTTGSLVGIAGILALVGVGMGAALGVHMATWPIVALSMATLPVVWLWFRRKRRLKVFATQLPDALEMLSRSLRAGQSLGFGFNMVCEEMSDPISTEFGRVFEEQNLGIPFEDTLNALTDRIPNLDLKFFVTAIILQRQTGGDLAEILDKIGSLIRDRFRIWGQVQALTGEGRLSGIVLLALPFVLFIAVYKLNPEYISVLFTDPMGKQMLAGAAFLQLVGALMIRKIVNIKV